MRKLFNVAAALAAAAVLTTGFAVTQSEAAPRCRPSVTGTASSLGLVGTGSAKAREAARANWQRNAATRYGRQYARWSNARDIRWDCKPGFILPATCVVVAQPCRR